MQFICQVASTRELSFLLCTSTLLWKKYCLDVGEDAALGNGHTSKQLVQLLVVPDGKLQMPRNDARLLVVPGSVTSQLQDLCSQILHHRCHVNGCTSSNSLGIVSLPEQSMNPAHWELKSCPTGAGLGLSLHLATLSASRHVDQGGSKKVS